MIPNRGSAPRSRLQAIRNSLFFSAITLLAFAFVTPTAPVLAQESPAQQASTFQDGSGIAKALLSADRDMLARLPEQWPGTLVELAAPVALARVDGRLDEAITAGEACLAEARKARQFVPVTLCGLLKAGALERRGDLVAWARETERTRRIAKQLAAELDLKTPVDRVDVYAQVPDVNPLMERESSTTAERGESNDALASVPYVPTPDVARVLGNVVRFRIDDRYANGVIDTGSRQTLVVPTLAPPAFMDWIWLSERSQRPGTRTRLAQAGELQIGDLRILRPFLVTHPAASMNNFDAIIGLDVLSRFGKVLIEEQGVDASAARLESLRCDNPLTFASDVAGLKGWIYLRLNIDGVDRNVAITTGKATELTRWIPADQPMPPADEQLVVADDFGGAYYVKERQMSSWLVAGGELIPVQTRVRRAPPGGKGGFAIGAGILRKASIFLDFDNRKACLVPKVSLQIMRDAEE